MQNLALIATVTLIHLLAVVSPGPDFIVCLKNSLTYSRKTGIWTAVGFGAGITVHINYCLAGIALLISQSILVFNAIKWLGAAYLAYIGLKSLLAKSSKIELEPTEKKPDLTPWHAFRIGFLTNVLNPKATLLFLSLFTLVISPETPFAVVGLMSAIMILNTIFWFSLVATFITQRRVRGVFDRFQGAFNKAFGSLLIALGIKIALTER